jgi:signal transduction histidine kinase
MRIDRRFVLRTMVSLAILLAAGFVATRAKQNGAANAEALVVAHAFAGNRNVHLMLESVRIALDVVATYVDVADGKLKYDERLDRTLDAIVASNLFAQGIAVFDIDGTIVRTAEPRLGLGLNFANADFFQVLSKDRSERFAFGAPFYSLVFKRFLVPMALPIRDIDGRFFGVIAAGMPLSEIQTALGSKSPVAAAKSRLWRSDGLLLAASANDVAQLGEFYPNAPVQHQRPPGAVLGVFAAYSAADNATHIFAWRNNLSYPVFVSSDAALAPLLRPAWIETVAVVAAALGLLALVWTNAFLAERELRRKDRSVAELRIAWDQARAAGLSAEKAQRAAQDASQAKTLLLARFSHEFRTPLNAVLGFTEMVRLGYCGPLPERARENLGHVHNAGDQLNRMIATLLDLSRLELDPATLASAPHDLAPAFEDAVAMVAADARGKSIAIRLDLPRTVPSVDCDRTRIVQVLVNLLSNAVRHAPIGGIVTAALAIDADRVHFAVEDSGPGVAPDRLSSVFEPFGGDDPTIARADGEGLGLALARQIMRAHGGDLTLANLATGGCRASASFPLTRDRVARLDPMRAVAL